MDKGISFYFGYKIDYKQRAKMIKDAGFDAIMTTADNRFDYQNGTIIEQVRTFDKLGLKLSSLHMTYIDEDLHYFWEDGEEGERQKLSLIKDVEYAKEFGFTCVVVHLKGQYSEIGIQRLLQVLDECEKLDIPLALENVDDPKLFLEVFDKIKSPYLKFCYDSGHNNFIDKGYDYFKNFKNKLIALHLHDNDGTSDQHTLNRYGNIDWQKIGEKLRGCNVSLDYELLLNYKPEMLSPEECLFETKRQADELERIILGK